MRDDVLFDLGVKLEIEKVLINWNNPIHTIPIIHKKNCREAGREGGSQKLRDEYITRVLLISYRQWK